jgi:hypothetical protein
MAHNRAELTWNFIGAWATNLLNGILGGRAELREVASCLFQADLVRPTSESWMLCLDVVILPEAYRADLEGAWWFLRQGEVAAAKALEMIEVTGH